MLQLALLLGLLSAEPAAPFVVTIDELPSADAPVFVALFDSKKGWSAASEPIASVKLEPSEARCEWSLEDLAPGTYALRAFQDLNDNGELDRTKRGRPTEPYGFSGEGKARLGPPSFRKASFDHSSEGTRLELRLRGKEALEELDPPDQQSGDDQR